MKIFEAFIQRDADGIARPNTALIIFLCAWAVGIIVISLWNLISQRKFFRYLMANGDYATDHERAIFSDVVKDVLKNDKNVVLRKTDVITGTVVVGLIHKTVLIPDETYTDDELNTPSSSDQYSAELNSTDAPTAKCSLTHQSLPTPTSKLNALSPVLPLYLRQSKS